MGIVGVVALVPARSVRGKIGIRAATAVTVTPATAVAVGKCGKRVTLVAATAAAVAPAAAVAVAEPEDFIRRIDAAHKPVGKRLGRISSAPAAMAMAAVTAAAIGLRREEIVDGIRKAVHQITTEAVALVPRIAHV